MQRLSWCLIVLWIPMLSGVASGQQIDVPAGFTAQSFAPIPAVAAIELAPRGSLYGNFLYVATRGSQLDPNDPDLIQRIDLSSGEVSLYYELPAESDPVDMEFGHAAGLYPDKLYISVNNRDGGQAGDNGGAIVFLDPDIVDPKDPARERFLHPGSGNPVDTQLSAPGVIAFDSSGAIDGLLYVENTTAPPYDIARVDPSGNRSTLVAFPPNPSFTRATSMDFPPAGSAFEELLYFSDDGRIRRVDPNGNVEDFALIPAGAGRPNIAFSSGPFFGDFLYAFGFNGVLYRIAPNGAVEIWATGFSGGTANDPSFDENLKHLFVENAGTIYRISAAASGTVNLGAGPVQDVLFVNGQAGEVTVNVGAPISLGLNSAPQGPASSRIYAIYFWFGEPEEEIVLHVENEEVGCFVNPIPFDTDASPQPRYCLAPERLFGALCGNIPNRIRGQESLPLNRVFTAGGELTVTIQALLLDRGSQNTIRNVGVSASNAIILRTVMPCR